MWYLIVGVVCLIIGFLVGLGVYRNNVSTFTKLEGSLEIFKKDFANSLEDAKEIIDDTVSDLSEEIKEVKDSLENVTNILTNKGNSKP